MDKKYVAYIPFCAATSWIYAVMTRPILGHQSDGRFLSFRWMEQEDEADVGTKPQLIRPTD